MNTAKMIVQTAALAFCVLSASPAGATNNVYLLPLPDSLDRPDVHEAIDGTVKFYFGDAQHPAVLKTFDSLVANQKTSSFGIADIKACNRVFADALSQLQKRAHELGANAVINIHSFYRREDISSQTDVQCHVGFLIAGVALKGDFVTLAAP